MSFTDQQGRRSPASIATVLLVHAAIGYAFYAGLAMRFMPHEPTITSAYDVPDDPPPPLHDMPPPPPLPKTLPHGVPTASDPVVRVTAPDPTDRVVAPAKVDAVAGASSGGDPGVALPPTRVDRPDLTRAPAALGDRRGWVTDADYPPSALRAGAEGTTAIAVTIGVDGRVTACEVTESSGNAALDDAACRVYARRARFRPGLDDAGYPAVSRHADRVRWQVPRD